MKKKTDGDERLLPKPIQKAIGEEVKRLRGERNQTEFAFDCRLADASNISRVEQGKQPPSLHTLYAIAAATKRKMHHILAVAEGEAPPSTVPAVPDVLAHAWHELSDNARDVVENYIMEVVSLERNIPTYYAGPSKRRLSFEEKFAALPRPIVRPPEPPKKRKKRKGGKAKEG